MDSKPGRASGRNCTCASRKATLQDRGTMRYPQFEINRVEAKSVFKSLEDTASLAERTSQHLHRFEMSLNFEF